ncbi:hypothetical protein G5V59_02640 [Nocardioides sp. W3-2-3]|uniref:hypothetical protein n=1 Tax=Nocardioides convexus TaxID=2712224 RepID=UPI00241822CA|nr:hypothetical protein [Nocardioides convexus]NGZ99650.1 hypothetical protein [Nocardioides convexus]
MREAPAHPKFEAFKARHLENPTVRVAYEEIRARRDAEDAEVAALRQQVDDLRAIAESGHGSYVRQGLVRSLLGAAPTPPARDPWGGLCPNGCGEPGPHFVPPSLGDRGFFTCAPAAPPTTDAEEARTDDH